MYIYYSEVASRFSRLHLLYIAPSHFKDFIVFYKKKLEAILFIYLCGDNDIVRKFKSYMYLVNTIPYCLRTDSQDIRYM